LDLQFSLFQFKEGFVDWREHIICGMVL
jgi:hypothetical protein